MSDFEEDEYQYGYDNNKSGDDARWNGLPNTSSPTMPGAISPITLMQQINDETPDEDGIQWEERSEIGSQSSSIRAKKYRPKIKIGSTSSSSSFTNVTISSMAQTPKKDRHLKKNSGVFIAFDGFYNILMTSTIVIGAFLLIGGLMVIIDISQYDVSNSSSTCDMGKWALCMGVLITIIGVTGMMLIKREGNKKPIALTFFVILFIFTILDIILCIQMVSSSQDAQSDPTSYWNGMTDGQKSWVQDNYQCCGYTSFVDDAVDPCPASCMNGCSDAIDSMVDQLYVSSIVCIWLSVIGIVLMSTMTIFYVLYAPRNDYKEVSDGNGEYVAKDEYVANDDRSSVEFDEGLLSVSTINEDPVTNSYTGKLSMII